MSFVLAVAEEGQTVIQDTCHTLPLTTYCQFRGIAAVAVSVIVFIGFPMFILSTNIGIRKATGVTLAALFGYLALHGILWMIYPRGPIVTREILGLPPTISSRMPAILLLLGAGILTAILCIALNRLDRPAEEEATLSE